MKKVIFLLAIFLVGSVAFAQQSPTGQGPTVLNGGMAAPNWANVFAQSPAKNNLGGPGLGRHNLQDATTQQPLGCETCHLPHTASTYGSSFLWAWSTVPVIVTTYQTDSNPSGVLLAPPTSGTTATLRSGNVRSMLCLSCHDGASASANGVLAGVTSTGTPYPLLMTSGGVGSLGAQHPVDAGVPVNCDYQQPVPANALATSADSASGNIGLDKLPLWDTAFNVECSTCHDQHNDYQSNQGPAGGVPFLRVANTNGTYLCRECHNQ